MATNNTLKVGDRVLFDVKGDARSPFGSAIVTYVDPKGGLRIQPESKTQFAGSVQFVNIRKVGW